MGSQVAKAKSSFDVRCLTELHRENGSQKMQSYLWKIVDQVIWKNVE